MKTLETIQKAFRVFQTIAKIIHILCIVGAVMCGRRRAVRHNAVSRRAGIWHYRRAVNALFRRNGFAANVCAAVGPPAFMLAAEAVLFGISRGYLKAELADGTPFTVQGANGCGSSAFGLSIFPSSRFRFRKQSPFGRVWKASEKQTISEA